MAKQAKRAERPAGVLSGARQWITGGVTMAAALMALLVNAKNLGISEYAGFLSVTIADRAAHRIVLMPRADTLLAVGEPAVITATVTDARGAALSGATLRWTSSDTTVASVDSSGLIVARGPGRATVEARVRDVIATAAVLVRPVPEHLQIEGDSAVRVADGDSLPLAGIALDARGHAVRGAVPAWNALDGAVARVDSNGVLRTLAPGRTLVVASLGELRDTLRVEVALTPALVALEAGADQRALAGRALASPLVLQVRTGSGIPVPNVRVEFTSENGEGNLAPAAATTDAAGRVRTSWTLGATAGLQRAFARAAGVDSALVLRAEADPAARNARIEVMERDTTGAVLQELAQPVRVRLTDSAGTALAGVRLTWAALDGGTTSGAERTDSLGRAEARWTLGPRSGPQRLLVQAGNPRVTPAVTVRTTARAAAATGLEVRGGNRQHGIAGRALTKAVEVQVRDSLGNPVVNAQLRALPASGSVEDSLLVTDEAGTARTRWTLGARPGEQRLAFALAGSKLRVTAVAAASAGPAATIVMSARAARPGAGQVIDATASDEQGNPVSGALLQFAASNGTLSISQARTDARGRAQVTWRPPAPHRGEARITARIGGTRITAAQVIPAPVAVPARARP